jgi:HK97 family phage major capsid protein
MNTYIVELRRKAIAAKQVAEAVNAQAEAENRGLTEDEQRQFDDAIAQAERLNADANTAEQRSQRLAAITAPATISPENRGDDRVKADRRAVRQYVLGDEGAIREMDAQMRSEARASNNTDMNITTPADGGYLVPTGHYAGIIARANEIMLAPALGCMPVPGLGTTVNVPTGGAVNPFVATNEVGTFDIDGAAFGQAAMTLAKFTKDMILSDELQQDEGSQLLNYLNSYVGDAYGLTHNAALVTETLAGGTSVTLGAAAAATAADIPLLIGSVKDEYAARAQWIGKRATQFKYLALTGNNWQFVNTPQGTIDGFWGFPFNAASNMPAVGAGLKSLAFGAWQFMGYRTTGMTMLRDPYSKASTGQLVMHYYTRIVYKTLQQEAIVFGTHPTA